MQLEVLSVSFENEFSGPRADTGASTTARALNFESKQKNMQNVLDMAKAVDGSTNRLQAMKAAFKVHYLFRVLCCFDHLENVFYLTKI